VDDLIRKLFVTLGGRWAKININEVAVNLNALLGLPAEGENPFLDPGMCQNWQDFVLKITDAKYLYGGYMEDRSVVWRGHYHQPGHTIHLGVDFYVPAGTKVHMPCAGNLCHSFQDPDQNGGWGGKLIFRIGKIYLVLGHLTDIVSDIGVTCFEGTVVGSVADHTINGGWSPHLHVQLMTKYDPDVDGYAAMYEDIKRDFPNPNSIVWRS
jgi:peptidoglycan LD-endopeptidase LytH